MNTSIIECEEKYQNFTDFMCPPIYDGWLCWPPTPPGENATSNCPKISGTMEGLAYRFCMENGSWEIREGKGYTHYDGCILPELLDLLKMCDQIKECPLIVQTVRIIEMVGLSFSLVSLIISLCIFFEYRVLRNNRTKIHKNLFIATLLQVLFRLIIYVSQGFKDKETPYFDETCTALLEYFKTAMFMWMFIEGLYLHNMITVTVFQEYSYMKLYFYVGWMAPAVMTTAWMLTMILVKSEWRFYSLLLYYWILEGPRSTVIVETKMISPSGLSSRDRCSNNLCEFTRKCSNGQVNLLFLINIIRVLIVKLRESRTSEIEQVRKAVRAAIFLLPLMGIANILFLVDYRFDDAWKFALWAYPTYFLNTFQGFFVAVLYCFLNGEVQTAVKNSFYLRMSLRNHDYTPCRNLTLISTAPEPEAPAIHNNGEGPKWIRYCLRDKRSSNKKDINICDVNRRNSTIVTALTMVETKPFTREAGSVVPRLSNDETDTTLVEDKGSETKV